jgi:hypothetical protein
MLLDLKNQFLSAVMTGAAIVSPVLFSQYNVPGQINLVKRISTP